MRGADRAVDHFELLHRMLSGGRRTRPLEVERARAALYDLDGNYPADAIAATLVDCLVQRRLP